MLHFLCEHMATKHLLINAHQSLVIRTLGVCLEIGYKLTFFFFFLNFKYNFQKFYFFFHFFKSISIF